MQMGNECSSPHVASLEERPLVDGGEIPLVSFIIMHSLSMCPCKTNCLLSEFIILPAIFLYFISTPGDCLWEAFLRRRACGNRIRDLYAWRQGIRRQDKTSIYISGIHESAGRSVSVEKWTLPFSWSSNAIGWKFQWPNPVPVYFVFVIFGWRCLTKVKFENIHGKRINIRYLRLLHENMAWPLSIFTCRLCCCCSCSVGLLTRSLGLKAISTC